MTGIARTQGTFPFFGVDMPISSLTGVVSSIANLCVILMVVFHRKLGFVTAIVIQAVQFPAMIITFMKSGNTASLPGIFSTSFTIFACVLIYRRNKMIGVYQREEVEHLIEKQRASKRLFEQTATALVNAIDAKDAYSHGHSIRVADYSEMIARMMGKDAEESRRIYYSALLHDVGKIGIPNNIINKKGKLTPEEYDVIKEHPAKGNAILKSIDEYPYLSIGALSHHERYDGKGYPEGLKGEDINEIARIIAVADAYDAMSSNRSYRNTLPQQIVREEITKGAGTQFDPKIANIMQSLIDADPEYTMREHSAVTELGGRTKLECNDFGEEVSDGILQNRYISRIHIEVTKADEEGAGAGIILFDSLDGRVHDDEKMAQELCYFEYCEIHFDGRVINKGARKVETEIVMNDDEMPVTAEGSYDIEAVKYKDHVRIRIDSGVRTLILTIALPDSSRYAYIGLTGENCHIWDVVIGRDTDEIGPDFIPRIAEEISYIEAPAGDIPNVQIDGHRTDSSKGIEVKAATQITFRAMSLPTARLVWHCPFILIFTSEDGTVGGRGYREFGLIRLDGESSNTFAGASNELITDAREDFGGWDKWKELNKKGFECIVSVRRDGDEIVLTSENHGMYICNKTDIKNAPSKVYVAITGDQCAITGIKIKN